MPVFITGGSRGIGAGCVRTFAQAGHKVAFLYEKSEAAASTLAKETGALAIRADVADRAQVFQAVERAKKRIGPIDTLVCAAGIAHSGLFQDMTEPQLRRLMDVNTLGAFFASQAAAPDMISDRFGTITFISSVWGQVGASCEAAYSMSKGALIALTLALAKELGPSHIRVNCVAPGVIDTDMNARLTAGDKEALLDATPLGRIGTADDVAQSVLFLASEKARFITGQVLGANGGFGM